MYLRAALLALVAAPAQAHSPLTASGQEQLASALAAALLALVWLVYWRGQRRKPAGRARALAFHGAAVLTALALFGPLDEWAETSTAMHMVQHMLLMVVIPPLWVVSRPLAQLAGGGGGSVTRLWEPVLRLARHPVLAAYLHGAAIWFWHVPAFYMAAVINPWWHALEHACFLLTALLLWWAVLRNNVRQAPWSLLAVLFTLMHTGFLGAVLTFAATPLYSEARGLQDQQLAGLIMWVMGAVAYIGAAGWIAHRWYQQMLRRTLSAQQRSI